MSLIRLTLVFLLTFSFTGYTQYYKRAQLDSLEETLQLQDGIDEINTLLDLAEAYLYFQLDTAQLYVNIAQKKARQQGYDWGVYKSIYYEAEIQHKKGNRHVLETMRIKEKCANWFEHNAYPMDALLARISANDELNHYSGRPKAQEKAITFLEQAQHIGGTKLLALAWSQISRTNSSFFPSEKYAGSKDSSFFYLRQTTDSLLLTTSHYYSMFNEIGGTIPQDEMRRLEEINARWETPLINLAYIRMKIYPFALEGNIDSALYYYDKGVRSNKQYGGQSIYWQLKNALVVVYQQAKDYSKAIDYSLELAVENEKRGNREGLSLNYYRIGQFYNILKEYDQAIHFFLKSLHLLEELDNAYSANSVKRMLGDLYVLTEDYEKGKERYREVISWCAQQEKVIVINILLGNTYTSLAKLDQTQGNYSQSLANYMLAAEELNYNSNRVIQPKTGLLSMFLDMGAIDKADSLHQTILEAISEQYVYRYSEFYLQEGRLFMALNKYQQAINSLESYLHQDKTIEITDEKKEANFLLYEAYKKLGQIKNALTAFETYTTIKDSLALGTMKENVQKIQSDHEISLKESEIERLRQQQEISDLRLAQQGNELALGRLYIALLIAGFLLFVVIGYLFYRKIRLKKEEEKNEIKRLLEIKNLKAHQKMELAEVKNKLYANISHEFKTPLTLIRVPLMEYQTKVSGNDKIVFDSVLKNTDHLLEMLDDLLGISKIKPDTAQLKPSSFNLAGLLPQIKLNFAPLFSQKKIRLDWAVNLKDDHFYGDESKLNIVINNLLKNAFSHAPENGWVRCKVELDKALTIAITNKGKHINPDDLPHIFERFYRSAESHYSGSGIGLAWSKQIVELHNGTITVDNDQPGQVTFLVHIPAVDSTEYRSSDLISEEGLAPTPAQDSTALPHILVVEDNQEMRELLFNVLNNDFKLDFAENGAIGEEKAIQLQPDLIISDVMMPQKDGFELLTAIKENFSSSHIPVILLTARTDSTSRVTGLNQDADDYVAKPFDPLALKARINNLLRQRLHLHQLFSENPLLYSKQVKCTPIDADFIDRARKILEEHYKDGDFSVVEFCQNLALNKTSVNQKLKALTNQSIAEYIRNFRLEKASKLLLETQEPILSIAFDTGFNNPQVFNKSFKKKFNCTPSAFRAEVHE